MKIPSQKEVMSELLHNSKVQAVMKKLAEEQSEMDYRKAYKIQEREAKEIIVRMTARLNEKTVRWFAWFMRKVWKNMYEQVRIN